VNENMKKKIIGIFVCLLLISTVLPVSGNIEIEVNVIQVSLGNTLYVGGSGPNNYTKIQDAVDNASTNDTVFVYDDSSPYYERVQINTSISLIGEDRNTTVIDASGGGAAIFISSDNVSIYEFTLQHSYDGIKIDDGFGFCTIADNIIIDNDNGVNMIFSGNNNIILDNTFFDNNEWTIVGFYTHDNVISGNTIDHSPGTYHLCGIVLESSTGNNISGNTINNCDSGIFLDESDNNKIINNEISSGEYDGISLSESSNNKIIGNNISYNLYCGIEIDEYSNDNIIYHNNFINNYQNAADEGNNTWDDGEYGNYWSDYEDKYPDAKKKKWKGIWDTPYEIPGGDNMDMCPLIKQWPDSVSKPVQKSDNLRFQIWLNRFPILQKMLDVLGRFNCIYEIINGGI